MSGATSCSPFARPATGWRSSTISPVAGATPCRAMSPLVRADIGDGRALRSTLKEHAIGAVHAPGRARGGCGVSLGAGGAPSRQRRGDGGVGRCGGRLRRAARGVFVDGGGVRGAAGRCRWKRMRRSRRSRPTVFPRRRRKARCATRRTGMIFRYVGVAPVQCRRRRSGAARGPAAKGQSASGGCRVRSGQRFARRHHGLRHRIRHARRDLREGTTFM